MFEVTNISRFKIGVGESMLSPGDTCQVDAELAARVRAMQEGLLRCAPVSPPAKDSK
jgi:hypothetical protein